MTGTLRDRLAAVLGPGNDDTTAYAQADAVLEIVRNDKLLKAGMGYLLLHAGQNGDESTANAVREFYGNE